jgi:hypothetical protein
MALSEKLIEIQAKLKAPKDQYNSFGKYKYRSAESILESVKPLLKDFGLVLVLTDSIEAFGERLFLRATAVLSDGDERLTVDALAEIATEKKGMDASQITGTASSYARKYALNGLFLIDDTKDADTDEYKKQTTKKEEPKKEEPAKEDETISEAMYNVLRDKCRAKGKRIQDVIGVFGIKAPVDMTVRYWKAAVDSLDALPDK